MPLEIFSFLSSLVKTSPTPGDPKQRGDDHIRGIKTALVKSFAGFDGAIMVSGTDSGAANTYVLSPSEPLTEYSTRMIVTFLPANTNGGASTLNISGLGPRAIKSVNGVALNNGDIMAGWPLVLIYDGTSFRITAPTKNYIDQLVTTGAFPVNPSDAGKPLVANSTGTAAVFSENVGVALNEKKGADIAAASTTSLTAATGNLVHITGVGVTINAMTLPSGAERTVVFDGQHTLVHSPNLILPGAANITTAAGDRAIVRGDGAGIARVITYTKANGRAVVEHLPPGWVLMAPPLTPTDGVVALDFLNIFTSEFDDYEIRFKDFSSTGSGGLVEISLSLAIGGVISTDPAIRFTTLIANINASYGIQTENTKGSGIHIANVYGPASGGGRACGRISIQGVNNLSSQGVAATTYSWPVEPSYPGGSLQMNGIRWPATPQTLSGFRLSLSTGGAFGATGTIEVYGIRKA